MSQADLLMGKSKPPPIIFMEISPAGRQILRLERARHAASWLFPVRRVLTDHRMTRLLVGRWAADWNMRFGKMDSRG
jgi:hypothetical protein